MRDVARSVFVVLTAALLPRSVHPQAQASRLRFEISFPAERSRTPLDGRLLVLISADTAEEPRFQINDSPGTQQVFGIDVDGWKPGEARVIDASAFGYPRRRSPTCLAARTACKRSSIVMKRSAGATDTS